MTSIHRLQLQVLELGEKVKESAATKEKDAIRQALSPGIVLRYYNNYIESESRSSYLTKQNCIMR